MSQITINDVAKLANVSKATVSRVISKKSFVKTETRKKVEKAIKDLNYIPNYAAQTLSKSSSRILGIVLNSNDMNPLLNNTFFGEVLNDISTYLIENNYYSLYIHCENNKKEKEYIDFLIKSKRIDGLIFLRASEDETMLEYLEALDFPFSIIGRPNDRKKYLWVDNDNIDSSYNITKYLLEKNNRNICFIGGNHKLNVTKDRFKGYKQALNKFNIKLNKNLIIESDFDETETSDKLLILLEKIKIDAIFTTDDIFAIAAKKLLKKLNLKDIEVTGYNNSYLKKFSKEDFLTVDINVKKLGIASCDLVLKKINKQDTQENNILVNTKIIGTLE